MASTGHVLAKRQKAGRRPSFFDLWARGDEHFGLVCIMGLLRHWRQWPDFAGRSPARRPRPTVKLKPVAAMQAAARGQKVEAVIHEGKAGFFENTPRGNVVGARVGKNPVRPGETEDRVGERLDGFAREPFAAHLRRDNVAELDVPSAASVALRRPIVWRAPHFWVIVRTIAVPLALPVRALMMKRSASLGG